MPKDQINDYPFDQCHQCSIFVSLKKNTGLKCYRLIIYGITVPWSKKDWE